MDQNITLTYQTGFTLSPDQDVIWFVANGDGIYTLSESSEPPRMSPREFTRLGLHPHRQAIIGQLGTIPCVAVELDQPAPASMDWSPTRLRSLLSVWPDPLFALAGRAWQLLDWGRTERFCSRCATPLVDYEEGRARRCPSCELTLYPRISPCVIVAIRRGPELLLAQSIRSRGRFHSLIAGFVEPGENLEDAVQREVKEEVNLDVRHITYFASQPWPFPHSLMVGFLAEYAGGDLHLDQTELCAADWFTVDNLPPLPPPGSIAHSLIHHALTSSLPHNSMY